MDALRIRASSRTVVVATTLPLLLVFVAWTASSEATALVAFAFALLFFLGAVFAITYRVEANIAAGTFWFGPRFWRRSWPIAETHFSTYERPVGFFGRTNTYLRLDRQGHVARVPLSFFNRSAGDELIQLLCNR